MAGEETEVGSIVGYLRIDDSDWDAKLDAADAKAKAVGKNNPKITIEVTDAPAVIAALQAVKAQEDSVSSSSSKMKSSVKDANDSAFRPLLSTALLLGPALAPLAVLGGAAFGGLALGAVGVALGIKGISTEMTQGTVLGAQYTAGVNTLKGYLAEVEQTAARAILQPFNDSVDIATESLPQLNAEVGKFTGLLAGDAPAALDAAVSGLRIMDPLLTEVTQDVGRLVTNLDAWVNNGGLQKFADGAEAELPTVEKDLGQIVTAVGHIGAAFSSTGGLALSELGLLSRAINVIPTSQLDHVALATTLMFTAWKGYQILSTAKSAFDSVSGSVSTVVQWLQRDTLATQAQADAASAAGLKTATFAVATDGATTALAAETVAADAAAVAAESEAAATEAAGVSMSAALGPIGLVAAGIGILAFAFTSGSQAAKENAAATDDLYDALSKTGGVIDSTITAQTQDSLAKAGLYTSLGKLGLSYNTVTQAALGNKDALKLVDDATKNGSPAIQALGGVINTYATGLGNAADRAKTLADVQSQGTVAAQADSAAWDAYNAMQAAAKTAAQSNAQQIAQTTLNLQQENDAAGLVTQAFKIMNGGTLDVATAQTNLDSATLQVITSLKTNKGALDEHTDAGIQDRQAIDGAAQALQAKATADAQASGSTEQATAQYKANSQALLDQIGQLDGTTSEAYKYAASLLDISGFTVIKTQAELDTAAAVAALTDFQTRINSLTGKNITVTVNGAQVPASIVETPGGGKKALAAGGYIDGPGTATSDSIAVSASRGEFMVRESAVARPGVRQFLEALNRGGSTGLVAPGIGSPAAQAVSAGYSTPPAAGASSGATGSMTAQVTVPIYLDGQLIAQNTNEVNMANVRRN